MVIARIRKFLPLLIVLIILSGAGGTFYFRPPVLIVTDLSFVKLYGTFRLTVKGIKTSLAFFRRVAPVVVAESAGPDLMALAVDGASKRPEAVVFPSRYLEGARFYKEGHEKIPVFVTGGDELKTSGDASLGYIATDTVQDLYRAGLCAALLAGADKVLFFYDGPLQNEYREAFRGGLLAQEHAGDPVFLNSSLDSSSYTGIGCVVVDGPASKFLERNLKIPVILFSWADPAITPRSVKLIFDDSPWALVSQAIKSLPTPGEGLAVPSEPLVLLGKGDKKDFRIINDLVKVKFEKK